MFIDQTDLKTNIYEYQLSEITEGDTTITLQGCAAAIEEVRGYLAAFDTAVIFGTTGAARNPLLVRICVTVAVWHIIDLSNVDMIFTQAKERYDRAIAWLKGVQKGTIIPDLPLLTAPDGEPITRIHIRSNRKFGHGTKY